MKKLLLIFYLVGSLGLIFSSIHWLATMDACKYYNDYLSYLQEGSSSSGNIPVCMQDGTIYVGIFIFFLLISLIYLIITAFVLKLLGYKLTKK